MMFFCEYVLHVFNVWPRDAKSLDVPALEKITSRLDEADD